MRFSYELVALMLYASGRIHALPTGLIRARDDLPPMMVGPGMPMMMPGMMMGTSGDDSNDSSDSSNEESESESGSSAMPMFVPSPMASMAGMMPSMAPMPSFMPAGAWPSTPMGMPPQTPQSAAIGPPQANLQAAAAAAQPMGPPQMAQAAVATAQPAQDASTPAADASKDDENQEKDQNAEKPDSDDDDAPPAPTPAPPVAPSTPPAPAAPAAPPAAAPPAAAPPAAAPPAAPAAPPPAAASSPPAQNATTPKKQEKPLPEPDESGHGGVPINLHSESAYCFYLPPSPGLNVAVTEKEGMPFCTDVSLAPHAQVFPDGFVTAAHYLTTATYTQVTGTINPAAYNLDTSQGGGQYDQRDLPRGSCNGMRYFVNLVEPDSSTFCIRCCQNKADCNIGRSTYGCRNVVEGEYP